MEFYEELIPWMSLEQAERIMTNIDCLEEIDLEA